MDDSLAYRRALGAFATGVTVIVADGPRGPAGITVNSFTSVSLKPPIVLWCLDDSSDRYGLFAQAPRWGVTILGAEEAARAMRFASGEFACGQDDIARFPDGTPALSGGIARFAARTLETRTLGDHLVIAGQVEAFEAAAGAALTFFRGELGALTTLPRAG